MKSIFQLHLSTFWTRAWAYFGLALLGMLMFFQPSANADTVLREQTKKLFVFENSREADYWTIVNDSVMGGVSQSKFSLSGDGTARFQGNVSLDNFGGFASVRTYPVNYGLADYDGLKIRLLGDGKQYKLRLRTGRYLDGIAYQTDINTEPDTWMTIRVPFDQFVPVYRGRLLSNVPSLDPAVITQIGLMISDKQTGSFQLDLDHIEAYRWASSPFFDENVY